MENDDFLDIEVGKEIRTARTRAGLTQRKLAKLVSVTHTYICNVENGHASPSLQLLLAIARVTKSQISVRLKPGLPPENDPCCVVDGDCDWPANGPAPERPLPTCYHCGLPVCRECSSRRKHPKLSVKKPVRLCNTCQVELDGDDKIVMARTYKRAGY